MKAFWSALTSGLAKLAVYTAEHPDQVIAVVNAVKVAKGIV